MSDTPAPYTAKVIWERQNQDFLANAYSRVHTIVFDGGQSIRACASPHIVPPPWSDSFAIDPEEAFVASLSSCHMLWFLALASQAGHCVEHYEDQASGVLAKNAEGKLAMTEVALRPEVRFTAAEKPSVEEFENLHHKAHERCFIANSVTSTINCMPKLIPS